MTQPLDILTQAREAVQIQKVDLDAALDWREKNLVSDINCVSIGKISAFYPEDQTADVTIVYRRILTQQQATTLNDTGVQATSGEVVGDIIQSKTISVSKTIQYPVLSKCPVFVMGGGPGNITFPIKVGDECIVLFCDRDMDAWFQGTQDAPPNSDRTHDFSDAIVLVGIRSLPNSIPGYRQSGPSINNGGPTGATIAVDEKILLQVGEQTLQNALNSLCGGIISAVTSTIAALTTINGSVGGATLTAQIAQIQQEIQTLQNAVTAINGILK